MRAQRKPGGTTPIERRAHTAPPQHACWCGSGRKYKKCCGRPR
ncbi:SEC-C metal-binding domain-containing protein [Actinoplanes sp. N902-109]